MALKVDKKIEIFLRTFGYGILVALAVCVGVVMYNEYQMDHNRPERVQAVHNRPRPSVDETIPTEEQVQEWRVAPDRPRYLSIPSLGITNARVREVGVQSDGKLGTPLNIFDTAWYNNSALPGSGTGALLIDGHNGGPTLAGVFKNLGSLSEGAIITIERGDGEIFTYSVVERSVMTVAEADTYMSAMIDRKSVV
jgi:sortase (surface protein transpeptidase)